MIGVNIRQSKILEAKVNAKNPHPPAFAKATVGRQPFPFFKGRKGDYVKFALILLA